MYCNGPLKAETDYYVKLRAFTEAGFAETAYSQKIRTGQCLTFFFLSGSEGGETIYFPFIQAKMFVTVVLHV